MSNRLDKFTDFILRFLNEHASFATKRTQQAAQCDKLVDSGGTGPQLVARLLDNSEDIAEQYSRPISHEMPQRKGSAGRQCSEAPVTAQNSRDIPNAEQRISGRESGEGKVRVQGKVGNTALPTRPAPKKYFEMLRVDTACETIFDSNRWGDQVCLREGVGICKFCGSIVCKPCVTFEFCPNAPCGQSKHLVIVQ